MNRLFTADSVMPSYLIYPRALLKMDLSATENAVYMLLLDRARLSARNWNWRDREGKVFLCYPILELARALGRSDTAVKKALQGLEKRQLISRKRQGLGKPNRIYVLLPQEDSRPSPTEEPLSSPTERYGESPYGGYAPSSPEGAVASPAEGYGAASPTAALLPPNKNNTEKTTEPKEGIKRVFGTLHTLTLTAKEAREVYSLPDGEKHADRVALYMAGGWKFPEPMKTIRALARGVPLEDMLLKLPFTRLPPEPSPERPPSCP